MLALVRHAFELGVSHVTLYALSIENLQRPKEEVEGLFSLFRAYFKRQKEAPSFRFRALGELSVLPADIQTNLKELEARTQGVRERSVNVAVAYGGRQEILRAVNEAVKRGTHVCDEDFQKLLYTRDLPSPDLIIRTGKEKRLSNFLLYQAAYAELYFSDKMFPAFTDRDLERALVDYASRTRRFGKTDEQAQGTARNR